jgi:hypothetical protein
MSFGASKKGKTGQALASARPAASIFGADDDDE